MTDPETTRRRVSKRWCIVLTLLWVFANWPTSSGLGGFYKHAGFPFVFASGAGHFQRFDVLLLALDGILGVVVVIGVSWLCAWSRGTGR